MATSWLTTLISTPDRAFSNMYDVVVTFPEISSYTANQGLISFSAEAITFEGGFSLDTIMDEGLKTNFIKGFTRPRTMTITFRETGDFLIYNIFKSYWMDKIYNQRFNVFNQLSGSPKGKIEISFQETSKTSSSTFSLVTSASGSVTDSNGALIKSISLPRLSWKDSNALTTDVSFTIDSLREKLGSPVNLQKISINVPDELTKIQVLQSTNDNSDTQTDGNPNGIEGANRFFANAPLEYSVPAITSPNTDYSVPPYETTPPQLPRATFDATISPTVPLGLQR